MYSELIIEITVNVFKVSFGTIELLILFKIFSLYFFLNFLKIIPVYPQQSMFYHIYSNNQKKYFRESKLLPSKFWL